MNLTNFKQFGVFFTNYGIDVIKKCRNYNDIQRKKQPLRRYLGSPPCPFRSHNLGVSQNSSRNHNFSISMRARQNQPLKIIRFSNIFIKAHRLPYITHNILSFSFTLLSSNANKIVAEC